MPRGECLHQSGHLDAQEFSACQGVHTLPLRDEEKCEGRGAEVVCQASWLHEADGASAPKMLYEASLVEIPDLDMQRAEPALQPRGAGLSPYEARSLLRLPFLTLSPLRPVGASGALPCRRRVCAPRQSSSPHQECRPKLPLVGAYAYRAVLMLGCTANEALECTLCEPIRLYYIGLLRSMRAFWRTPRAQEGVFGQFV